MGFPKVFGKNNLICIRFYPHNTLLFRCLLLINVKNKNSSQLQTSNSSTYMKVEVSYKLWITIVYTIIFRYSCLL